jgi:hypothetical protein
MFAMPEPKNKKLAVIHMLMFQAAKEKARRVVPNLFVFGGTQINITIITVYYCDYLHVFFLRQTLKIHR